LISGEQGRKANNSVVVDMFDEEEENLRADNVLLE
jgi:hypothetical protein